MTIAETENSYQWLRELGCDSESALLVIRKVVSYLALQGPRIEKDSYLDLGALAGSTASACGSLHRATVSQSSFCKGVMAVRERGEPERHRYVCCSQKLFSFFKKPA